MGFKHGDEKRYHAKFVDIKTDEVIEEGDYPSFRKIDNRMWELVFKLRKLVKVIITFSVVILLIFWIYTRLIS